MTIDVELFSEATATVFNDASDANDGIIEQVQTPKKERKPRTRKDAKPTDAQLELVRAIWDAYAHAYENRYKKTPVRNGMINGQIRQLASRIGQDAPSVVEFYLRHNDGFYLKKCHPMSLCLHDAESLHTQMTRGVAVTSTMVKQFEKKSEFAELMDNIERNIK